MTLLPAAPCALEDDTAVNTLFPSIFLKQRSHNLQRVTEGSEDLGVSKHLQVGASTYHGLWGRLSALPLAGFVTWDKLPEPQCPYL